MAKRTQRQQARPSEPTQAQLDTMLLMQRSEARKAGFLAVCRYGCIAWIGWVVLQGVRDLSGRTTNADLRVGLVADLLGQDRVAEFLLSALAAACLCLMVYYRKQLRASNEHSGKLRQTYEPQLDPRRSTSGLLASGDTRPEDRNEA